MDLTALLPALLPDVLALARQAGSKIMTIYEQEDFGVVSKEDQSPLTVADLAANGVIVAGLEGLSPRLPILSEEVKALPYSERQQWQAAWLVDPLDGTKEFIKRNGEFTVNIALIQEGIPILGVVYAPALGVMYYGVRGLGAFKQEGDRQPQPIQVRAYEAGSPVQVVTSRSHAGPETEAFVQRIKGGGIPVELVSTGSSLKFCWVAEGKAHVYPRFGPTMAWDTAAAQGVVEQAGGTVTTLQGERLTYNREHLLNPYFVAAGTFPWQHYVGEDV